MCLFIHTVSASASEQQQQQEQHTQGKRANGGVSIAGGPQLHDSGSSEDSEESESSEEGMEGVTTGRGGVSLRVCVGVCVWQ